MTDVLFVMLLVALFALTAGAVAVCDRLLGSDETVPGLPLADDDWEGAAA